MQIHQIKPFHKLKKKKRIGRGGKRGTYSGRGIKGQKSRSGAKFQPIIRELIKKYHKLKGYRYSGRKLNLAAVNLSLLEKKFGDNETVTPKVLVEKKMVRKIKGRVPMVKILANGQLTKKLTIKNCLLSKNAKDKIEKAGGKII